MKKKKNNLKSIWKKRLEMQAEGDKMRAEGDKMLAEGYKMLAEGDIMWAEGDKMWTEAIIEVYGNIEIKWKNWNENQKDYECHLETGEIFRP